MNLGFSYPHHYPWVPRTKPWRSSGRSLMSIGGSLVIPLMVALAQLQLCQVPVGQAQMALARMALAPMALPMALVPRRLLLRTAGSSTSVPEASAPSSPDFWTDSQPIEESQPFNDFDPVEDDSQPIQDDFFQGPENEPVEESQQLEDLVNPYSFEGDDDDNEGEEAVTFGGGQGKVEVPPSPEVDKSPASIAQKSPVFGNQSLTDVSERRKQMAARLDAIKRGV